MKTSSLFIGLLILSSCTVVRSYTTKTTDIYGSGVIQRPVVVELEVSEKKVTGTATERAVKNMDAIKSLAVSDALKKAGADVLIEPQFETVTKAGTTTATVTGYPGNYSNFRNIQSSDVELLKVGVLQKANVYQPTEEKKKFRIR